MAVDHDITILPDISLFILIFPIDTKALNPHVDYIKVLELMLTINYTIFTMYL